MSYWKMVCVGCAFFAATAIASSAQTFTTLAYYPGYDQFGVFSPLVQGTDGNFYGTALDESGGYGSIYKITPAGVITVLYNFCSQTNCTDGAYPAGAPLVLGTDGNFYGVTYYGGAPCTSSGINLGCGTVFKMTPSGALTVLHSFNGTDGNSPTWLIQDSGGNFYGTAGGGTGCAGGGCGTIFKMTPHGVLTTLHNFDFTDGWGPTGLIQATDGKLYGTTANGGAYDVPVCEPYGLQYYCGTFFKITTGGVFTLVQSFNGINGAVPYVPPVQASDGNFYGTTSVCEYSSGCMYRTNASGNLKALYRWKGIDGGSTVGLIQATDGNLYGAGGFGYSSASNAVFKISLRGDYAIVYSTGEEQFEINALLQSTSGTFYGVYTNGFNEAVYSLDVGLGPFVSFVEPAAKVAQTAQILGQGLTGTTSVTFNGIAATSFSVVSDTYMTAVVPSGATTGPVVVTTPGGALTSNVSFRIIQ
jgi:uncharacterized repeat protein (TIGR03803 family)